MSYRWTRMSEDADFILQFAGIEFNLTGYVIARRVGASTDGVAMGFIIYVVGSSLVSQPFTMDAPEEKR